MSSDRRSEAERAARYDTFAAAFGLRPSASGFVCPCKVAFPRRTDYGRRCVHDRPEILDHSRLWIDRTGAYVLSTEPYWRPNVLLFDALDTACGPLGIHWTVPDWPSPHYPDQTTLILVHRSPVPISSGIPNPTTRDVAMGRTRCGTCEAPLVAVGPLFPRWRPAGHGFIEHVDGFAVCARCDQISETGPRPSARDENVDVRREGRP
jgi:hypothetical protein